MKQYMSMSAIADKYGICKNTVRSRVKEIKGQKRYRANAVIEDGNIVLISEIVFLDWLKYRSLILGGREKYADPFDPKAWVEYLGYK